MLTRTERTALQPWVQALVRLRWRLLGGFLLALVASLAAVGLLALSGWFITASALTGLAVAAGLAASLDIYTPGAGIRSFAIIRTIARYAERVLHHDAVLRLQGQWRLSLFRWLVQSSLPQQQQLRMGHVVQRLTQDLSTLDALYLRVLVPPLLAAGSGVLLVILVAVQQMGAALALAILLAGLWWLNTSLTIRLTKMAGQQEIRDQETLRSAAMDFSEALPELAAWQTASQQQAKLTWRSEVLLQQEQAQQLWVNRVQACNQAVLQIVVIGISGLALTLWLHEAVSGPVAIMLPLAALALGETWQPLADQCSHLGRILGAVQRLNNWQTELDHDARAERPGTNRRAVVSQQITTLRSEPAPARTQGKPDSQPAFGWENLELVRARQLPELPDRTLDQGEQLSVCGASGSGKSTLANTLAGLLAPAHGAVYVQGLAMHEWPAAELRTRLAYLPQQSQILQGTLAMNLRLAQPGVSDARLWEVLQQVELAERVAATAEQLNMYLGHDEEQASAIAGSALSGGEARRLCLARILLRDPQVVLLDEPFTGLDRATREKLTNNLKPWLANRTVIWFGHEPAQFPTSNLLFLG